MTKYQVTIDRERCIDCGITTGRCPTHARMLARLLRKNGESTSMGVFSEELYNCVRQLVEACPVKAIIIRKIEE